MVFAKQVDLNNDQIKLISNWASSILMAVVVASRRDPQLCTGAFASSNFSPGPWGPWDVCQPCGVKGRMILFLESWRKWQDSSGNVFALSGLMPQDDMMFLDHDEKRS